MIKYCVKCFLPSTKPDLYFNADGVCAACISFENRVEVDWQQREKDFFRVIQEIRSKSESKWDCIVPVSGGKDSTAQVIKIIELGLNPLCVTSSTCDLSEIGRFNLDNIKKLGVDSIEFSPNPIVRARLNKTALNQVGDISWPEHVGIFTIPVRAAVQFKVPLIIWGENSQNEYGGPASASENNVLNRRWLEEFGGLLGLRVSDLVDGFGFDENELIPYTYPTDAELSEVGVTGLFLGYYFPWDGYANYLISQARGFQSFGKVIEGSIVDFENLDNYQTGIHDYFKFLKCGFGRATDLVSVNIRRGRLTRNQGLDLIRRHDGKYPWTYLDKPLVEILRRIDVSLEEFNRACDRFTNEKLFVKDKNGKLFRDDWHNLVKINYDNPKE